MENKKNLFERFWYIFVIIAVVLIGVVGYLWFNNQSLLKLKVSETPLGQMFIEPEDMTEEIETDEMTTELQKQGSSDQIEEIEEDLQNTDLTGITKELDDIESEIESE